MEVKEPNANYLIGSMRKQTEVGSIPLDWTACEVAHAFEICNQRRMPLSRATRSSMSGPYPYYGPTGPQDWINEFRFDGEYALIGEDGDHFLKWRTQSMTLLVRGRFNVNNHAHALRAIADNHTDWFRWFFANRDITQYLTRQGASRYKLTKATLARLPCALPSPEEQRAISNSLTDADTLIDSLEQLLTKKRQIKQGAMRDLLTGKRRLPGFKDAWISRSMADLFEFSGGLSASRDQLGDVGVCYLHYGDIHLSTKTYIDLDLEHHWMPRLEVDLRKVSPTALLENGDVVFVDASEDDLGVSKHVVIHCQVAQPLISGLHTIVARSRTDELVDLYKRYCFQAPAVHAQFRFYAVGTKVSGVSKGNIGKIVLSVPSPVEQAEIAACLAEIDAEIRALEHRLTKALALKQAIAQALLTGRIRLVEPNV